MSRRKVNPIDKDKVVDNPGLLPFAHTVGSAIIRPVDKGKTKGVAMSAMYQQTEKQLHDLKEQVERLIQKAQTVHEKIEISEKIYQADCGFKPLPGHTYFLYERKKKKEWVLSMVAQGEWGANPPYQYIAKVELMADHTWDVLETEGEIEI